jgi:hypothetical protein
MPQQHEIITEQLATIDALTRMVPGSKLKSTEAVDALDFLAGLRLALSTPHHAHLGSIVFECSRELIMKAKR